MEKMDVKSYIDSVEKIIEESEQKISKVLNLIDMFPDISVVTLPGFGRAFSSKLANPRVDNYIQYSCSCCPDSEIEIRPYLDTEYGRVHSDPPSIIIGEIISLDEEEKNIFSEDWDHKLSSLGMSSSFICKVKEEIRED